MSISRKRMVVSGPSVVPALEDKIVQGAVAEVLSAVYEVDFLGFGRLPTLDHARRGERRPKTFAFLGFTHYCGWTRDGRFVVKRKTQSKRLTTKLKSLWTEARRRMHMPVRDQHQWLTQVLRGHCAYYGLPSNFRSMRGYSQQVKRIWYCAIRRRSQRRLTWTGFVA